MPRLNVVVRSVLLALAAALCLNAVARGEGIEGYYRQPALHGNTIVFVSEGDLWRTTTDGGRATRITSHAGDESMPAISPDGQTIAFVAQYEGPAEVYTMPVAGGLPTRLTFDAARAGVHGWTADGLIVASTDKFSTLPNIQLYTIAPETRERRLVPLAQASEGAFETNAESTLYFTRLQFQGSFTKRYKGGTAQNLWKFAPGASEAAPLTPDHAGTSKRPLFWQGRVYFLTDRDGAMNIWSMNPEGGDLRQHTAHKGFDVQEMSLHDGRICYRFGPDLRLLDLGTGNDRLVRITLDSDFDQTRERWVKKPMEYVTSAHISHDADRVALTARGRVFVFPAKQGRMVEAGRDQGVRYRNARFMPDGKSLVALSDKSGEVELWRLAANGVGEPEQLTSTADVLRWDTLPSPDGRYIATHDKNLRLWVYDTREKSITKIDESQIEDFGDFAWSGDSRWLAYVGWADNSFRIIKLWSAESGKVTPVTSDRFDSYAPAFSADGKWLYFLSDRNLRTVVPSPWGPNQPDPFLDKTTKIYHLALKPGLRSPFQPADELQAAKEKAEKEKPTEDKTKDTTETDRVENDKPDEPKPDVPADRQPTDAKADEASGKKDSDKKDTTKKEPPKVEIELEGIAARLHDTPVPPGNYSALFINDKAVFYAVSDRGARGFNLMGLPITNDKPEAKQVIGEVTSAQLSGDGKKFLVRKGDNLHIIDAAPAAATDLDKKAVDLSGWMLSIVPREEWRQMFTEAWRLERDYFYDTAMHGVNWKAMLEKYRPYVDRVATRAELSDLIAQMVAELSALHIFVRGGDLRQGEDQVQVASLGARLLRDEAGGGYRVEHIFLSDPDDPHLAAPLARPGVDVKAGDIILAVNGVGALAAPDIHTLLRNQAGKQMLLRVKAADGGERDIICVPITQAAEADLRYHEWQYTRRQLVEEWGKGQIGYLHLRAMGGDNFTEFVRGFYPIFNRKGLIIDVRHNRGGNIDSWILSKLMRKAWFFWSPRVGNPPQWNMQYAFRGHMVTICNERTASDGEAFAEGFRRLGLGKVLGTRTWGGEIWLSSSNILVDRGIATAAEFGVYGPEGEWLIEGHGVDPDFVVDNPPHATFKGEDAQLRAAVEHLLKLIEEQPIPDAIPPAKPDKSFEGNR